MRLLLIYHIPQYTTRTYQVLLPYIIFQALRAHALCQWWCTGFIIHENALFLWTQNYVK
jgi:hypothetical protein